MVTLSKKAEYMTTCLVVLGHQGFVVRQLRVANKILTEDYLAKRQAPGHNSHLGALEGNTLGQGNLVEFLAVKSQTILSTMICITSIHSCLL